MQCGPLIGLDGHLGFDRGIAIGSGRGAAQQEVPTAIRAGMRLNGHHPIWRQIDSSHVIGAVDGKG